MKLTKNLILLAPLSQKFTSANGVVLPPQARYQPDPVQFRVLAVGPGTLRKNKRTKVTTLVPPEVVPGDRVLVDFTWGTKHTFPDGRIIVEDHQCLMKW